MTDHPTPQPGGRTAEEVLDALRADKRFYEDKEFYKEGIDRSTNYVLRQLFNAIYSEVIGEDESSANEDNSSATDMLIQSVRNNLRAELRQRLQVFFNQPEASGKDGGK